MDDVNNWGPTCTGIIIINDIDNDKEPDSDNKEMIITLILVILDTDHYATLSGQSYTHDT